MSGWDAVLEIAGLGYLTARKVYMATKVYTEKKKEIDCMDFPFAEMERPDPGWSDTKRQEYMNARVARMKPYSPIVPGKPASLSNGYDPIDPEYDSLVIEWAFTEIEETRKSWSWT